MIERTSLKAVLFYITVPTLPNSCRVVSYGVSPRGVRVLKKQSVRDVVVAESGQHWTQESDADEASGQMHAMRSHIVDQSSGGQRSDLGHNYCLFNLT